MNKVSQKRRVDGLMDAYVSWREAEPSGAAGWGVGSR
jgi:hypothetical protein